MFEVLTTEVFDTWLAALKDRRAQGKILARLRNAQRDNLGDVAPVGRAVSEMRIHHGPGYRVYFRQQGRVLIVLLCGGTKKTQTRDIKRAKAMAQQLESNHEQAENAEIRRSRLP